VLTSQSVNLTYISTQKVSSKLFAWGTDGAKLYPLFNRPSATLIKRLDTKLYGTDSMFISKQLYRMWTQMQDFSANSAGIFCQVSFAASNDTPTLPAVSAVPSGVFTALNSDLNILAPAPAWPVFGTGTAGVPFFAIGARLSSTSPDFAIGNLIIGYTPTVAYA
jgi:hypothetical protein